MRGPGANGKLIVSWLVGARRWLAFTFTSDLAAHIKTRIEFTTDGHWVYLAAVEDLFGADVNYAMLTKV